MNPPEFEWDGTFEYAEWELELIGRINSFLTRPLSPRWIYYGIFDVPDAKKQRMLNHVLNKARKDSRQLINRDLVTDDTRVPKIWKSSQDLAEFIQSLVYVRDIWQDQPDYMEVWMEDQASLEAVLKSPRHIIQKYRMNARYCKGFNSIGAMWTAYNFFKERDKPIRVLYYGDLNPSGWAIPVIIVRQFQEMGLDITLHRRALNPEHLSMLGIPAYTKVSGDPRRKEFNELFGYGEWEAKELQPYRDEHTGKTKWGKEHLNVDLEKIPIDTFESMLDTDIRALIDLNAYRVSIEREKEEDKRLDEFREGLR
jgi:hypothetical protein